VVIFMPTIDNLLVKLYLDGASVPLVEKWADRPWIEGFTTNPTIMRAAGVIDYVTACKELLAKTQGKPISFEVFADDEEGMFQQGMALASWGSNVYVKVPITNTKGTFSGTVIERLTDEGVQVNVTAVMTYDQVLAVMPCLDPDVPAIIS
jgi:transaldolase